LNFDLFISDIALGDFPLRLIFLDLEALGVLIFKNSSFRPLKYGCLRA